MVRAGTIQAVAVSSVARVSVETYDDNCGALALQSFSYALPVRWGTQDVLGVSMGAKGL